MFVMQSVMFNELLFLILSSFLVVSAHVEYTGVFDPLGVGCSKEAAAFTKVRVLDTCVGDKLVLEALRQSQKAGEALLLRAGNCSNSSRWVSNGSWFDALRNSDMGTKVLRPKDFKRYNGQTGFASTRRMNDSDYNVTVQRLSDRNDTFRLSEWIDVVRSHRAPSDMHVHFTGDDDMWQSFRTLGIAGPQDEGGRYPLFPEKERLKYHTLFVQPSGFYGGPHLDDLSVHTYFFLRLLEGRKRARLWPIHDAESIDSWICEGKLESTHGFLERPELRLSKSFDGYIAGRFTSNGFEWSPELPAERENLCNIQNQASEPLTNQTWRAPVSHCFIELEMLPGDELFVSSGIPHQFFTTEPSLTFSCNYQFDNHSSIDLDLIRWAMTETGMDVDELDHDEEDDSLHEVEDDLTDCDSFDKDVWAEYRQWLLQEVSTSERSPSVSWLANGELAELLPGDTTAIVYDVLLMLASWPEKRHWVKTKRNGSVDI